LQQSFSLYQYFTKATTTHIHVLLQVSWAIPCQFSGSGQVTLSNFLEILLKLSLPHMMNICKIWMKSVKKWHYY